jgi:sterol desaturase/sphingolipid hydroxylase (fatty acid hydroxylase superfamily)
MVAIPVFSVLIGIEMIVAKRMKIRVNNPSDMISSLSSGITNTVRDGLKYGFIIISYSWLVDHITLYNLEPVWAAVVIAFFVEDFTEYWLHRLNHRVRNRLPKGTSQVEFFAAVMNNMPIPKNIDTVI